MKELEHNWLWFILTIVGSFLPTLAGMLVGCNESILLFDFKDIIFASMGMNLSNLGLVAHRNFDGRNLVISLSFVLITLVSIVSAVMLMNDLANKDHNILVLFFGILLAMFSVLLSFKANALTRVNAEIGN